jgi:membrane fusion protein (multidrug efflux system)
MFIEVRLATQVRPGAVVIPEDAVLPLQGSDFVWVAKDGKATRKQVDLGVRTPGFVEARSGVEPGELVVVGGVEMLQEGAPVQPRVVERGRVGGVADTASAARGGAAPAGAADTTSR